jgi:N utilization substance protein A
LEKVPGLGEGLVEKLNAGGVTTVEALADMTPEQLEAIEGIGPKTVEKISLAVNNYFASLETGEAAPLGEETDATAGLTVEEPAPETAAEVDAAEFEDAEAPVEAAAEAEEASAPPQPGADRETSAQEPSAEEEAAQETKETE